MTGRQTSQELFNAWGPGPARTEEPSTSCKSWTLTRREMSSILFGDTMVPNIGIMEKKMETTNYSIGFRVE